MQRIHENDNGGREMELSVGNEIIIETSISYANEPFVGYGQSRGSRFSNQEFRSAVINWTMSSFSSTVSRAEF